MSRTRLVLAASVCAAALLAASPSSASTTVTTAHGTWTAYPGQSTTYQTAVQQPVNADGTSNFKSNGKAVIPVKFKLSQGTGAFVFASVLTNNPTTTTDDYSYLNWHPAAPLTFADITSLVANYAFTTGDCAGGSLRWTVRLDDNGTDRNLDIHYQPGADGLSQQTCAAGTSGANLIGSTDTIYVTQEFNGHHSFPSDYNNTYADALSQLGTLPVRGMTLIVDSGWGANGDQVVNLSSATVGVGNSAAAYTETFTPQPASAAAATCPTAPATVQVVKLSGASSGTVNEPVTVQPQDDNSMFRIVDCSYMYNLATSSLSGPGHYQVSAVIGGVPASNPAEFDLR
jgi:hypothetical protein